MKKDLLDYTFAVGIIIKGIDGFLEIIGGFLLLLIKITALNGAVIWLTQHELIEDPSDLLANFLLQLSHSLSLGSKIFAALYLVSHGIIKIVLVWSLLRHKLWAYPAALVFLLLFIFYQSYQLSYRYSIGLMALTVFDVLILLLTLREYRKLKSSSI